MAQTPTVIVAASNLTSNIGLAPNVTMTGLFSTVTSNSLVSSIAQVTPGVTTAGNTLLSTYSFNVAAIGLPLWLANANTTVATVQTQVNNILPANGDGTYNISRFAGILSTAGSFAVTSDNYSSTLAEFYGQQFGDVGIKIADYQSSLTNGISAQFAGSGKTSAQIKASVMALADAVENLGEAYNVRDLPNLGRPASFIRNLISLGFVNTNYASDSGYITVAGFLLPTNWDTTMDDAELEQFLGMITGPMLEKIIKQSGMVLPYPDAVGTAAQLLDLSMVFPTAALAAVPGGTFAGLANELVNLGGTYTSFADLADLLRSIEIADFAYLNTYTAPIPAAVYNNMRAKLGTGSAPNGSPAVTDMLGTVAGVTHIAGLQTVANCLTTAQGYSAFAALQSALTNLSTAVGTGNATYINANIAATWTAANTVNSLVASDATLGPISTTGNAAVVAMQAQVSTEITNLALAGISLTTATTNPGVHDALSLANSLHDYGVDAMGLGFNTLLSGMAQSNVGGDAVQACLLEGRNMLRQQSRSVVLNAQVTQ